MRPLKLKLTGFAGIASGRGKNEIEIDFSDVTPGAQIVALSGPNGAGKTTIMDNMHPFRVMPSRSSSPTPGAFSFYDHIVGEGSKELDWEHEGNQYRSVLKFKTTAKTKKQECYLFVLKDGQTSPWVDGATGLISDGKSDTYDRAIELILGKPEVFFTAQFSAQGKLPIGKMTAGEIKSLLGQMLGMEKISGLGAKAQAVVKELKPHLNAAHDTVAKLQSQAGSQALMEQGQGLQAQVAAIQQDLARLAKNRDEAVSALAVAKSEFAMQEQNRLLHANVMQQLQQAQGAHEQKRKQVVDRHSDETKTLREQHDQAQKAVSAASALVMGIKARITALQRLADKAQQIESDEKLLVGLTARQQSLRAEIDRFAPAVVKLDEVRNSIAQLQQKLASVQTSGEHIASVLEAAKATASLLGEVPCHGTVLAGKCKLLAQANAAAREVPSHEVKLIDARKSFKDGRDQFNSQKAELDALLAQEAQAKKASADLQEVERAIGQCSARLAERQYVEDAIRDLPLEQEKLVQAQQDQVEASNQAEKVRARLDARGKEQSDEIEAVDRECAGEIQRLNDQIKALPQVVDATDLQNAERVVQEIEAEQTRTKENEERVAQAIRELQSKVDRAANAEIELDKAREKVNAISAEISQWTLLAKALGTDGIIAMQIDDAGPAISTLANQLLEDCYGGRFQISLVTQAQTATGIQKEAFLIQVEDTQRGESKLLDAMSGGEKVWINECLVRAIALHMAQTADTRFETLFSDESDGALDPERKRQYMQMKRAVLERGGYSREYLITQTPELLNLCDAVIDVSNI